MNKIHTLSWGVIAVIMAMHQVQAESTFDYANYPRPDLYSKESWLFRDETARIFDGAGHLLPTEGTTTKIAGNYPRALLLLAPSSVFAMGTGDKSARRQAAFALSGDAEDSAEADALTLIRFDSDIKKHLRLKHIVIAEQSKWILNQPLITDATNTAAARSINKKKSSFTTVHVLNGALFLKGNANVDAKKTIIHEAGLLGGRGVISGDVKNEGGVISVGYNQDEKINSSENNQAVQGSKKNALEITGSYSSRNEGKVIVYIDAQKPPTEPYLIIKQGVQGTSLLIIDNIKDDNIQNQIIRNNGLQLITAMKSANARAFTFAPQEIGAYFFFLDHTNEGQHQWVLSGQPSKAASLLMPSDASKERLLTQSPGDTLAVMALPPPKPPRMLSNNQAAPELASLRETASEAALSSEAVVSISARDVAYDGTPLPGDGGTVIGSLNATGQTPPLPPRNGKSSAAGQVKLTSNDDDQSEAVAPLRRESRALSYVSLAPSSASDGVYAELTPLHRDSGLASVDNPDLASSSGNTREVVVKAAPASSIAGDSPSAVNTGVYSAREDCDTGRRDSVNSAERSVFDIRDRRTFSEDSLALSAISNSTVRSFSGEGGDALFVPVMPDAAMNAGGEDDMARQPDADKGEDVSATPLAASLPEIDARRTVASRTDDKTGDKHHHHRGEPSPLVAGNDNPFPSLTDGGNADVFPGRASDSGYLNLVNETHYGVLCEPVSGGRDSGYLSPADGDNVDELPRLDEGASRNPVPEANTSDNLSGNVMENQADGDNVDELPRLDEGASRNPVPEANTSDNLSGNVMENQAGGDNVDELPRLDEGASRNPIPEANTTDNLSGNVMENVTEGGIANSLPAGLPSFAPPTVIVPAVGVYAANHALANTLFISRRSERNSAAGMTVGSLAMNADPRPTLWLRILGGETHAFVGNGSLQTRTKRQVVQGGGTLLQFSRSGQDSGHVGVMFGAGKSMTLSRSTRVSSHASGGLQGYSVGLYAGWQQQPGLDGAYIDGQLSYSWFNNDVQRTNVPMEHYRSAGVSGTLESGYRWRLHQGERFAVFIEPLWQMSWMGVKTDRLSTRSAYRDVTLTSAPWQTRLGTRLSLCAGADPSGNAPSFQPYVEINWLTTSQPFGVQTGHGRYVQDGRRQLTEIKVGHEGQLTSQIGVWGHLAFQRGAGGFSDTAGSLGVKVQF